ncbi:hypothetical protein VCHC37A1_3161B, partial [Vibrio cholerae HC-37A1]
CV